MHGTRIKIKKITLVLYKLRGFCRGVAEDSVFQGYDSTSRDERIPTFRGNVMHPSSRFEKSVVLPDAIIFFPHDKSTYP